ncbi:hypothetical protein JCM18899A_18950 [Nocardioides sp. AN3]
MAGDRLHPAVIKLRQLRAEHEGMLHRATEKDAEDAKTLAAWCSRSGEVYNLGAWQAALLLRPKSFREAVARNLEAMNLEPDHPATAQWGVGLEPER